MSSTLKRTSMALDAETVDVLEKLSLRWNTSKAALIRKAVKKLEEDEERAVERRLAALKELSEIGLTKDQVEQFKAEIKAERMAERDPWAEHFERQERLQKKHDPS